MTGRLHLLQQAAQKQYHISDENVGQQWAIAGLLGIININGFNFVLGITEKQFVGKLDGANIYLIKDIELFAFDEFNQSIRSYIDGLKKLLTQGFYFSYNTDLTSNRQRSTKFRQENIGTSNSIWDSSDKRYFWNYNICQDFFYQKVDARWIVPIIQGFVEYQSNFFDGKDLEIVLISRRRHAMAGTRYNARGLDDEGNTANFVETEQILCYKNYIFSFIQIRGSVPLFWQQKGIQAHTSIKRNHEITSKVFDKHLSDLVNDYRLVIFINLLQKARTNEDMLTQALEKQFQACQPKCVKYTYFDFHTETKGDNFHRLNDLMVKIEEMLLKKFQFFVEDRNTARILQEQKGVLRTNCLDCLDRTNVTQTKIAMRILECTLDRIKSLNRSGMNAIDEQKLAMLGFGGDQNDGYIFETAKHIWAENGDHLSKQYAGTTSTITSVTKTGKQGWMGKLDQMKRGVQRFIVNNLEDDFKHECIKLLINQHPKQIPYGIKASLEKQLEQYKGHFSKFEKITGCVFAWNCAGNTPSPMFDISNLLMPEDQNIVPDFFVIGLQEMVKLNAKSVIQGKDKERVLLWEKVITRSLNKKQKYVCIDKKTMVGQFILLFTKDELKNRVSNMRTSKVKTGFAGQSGNKGAVALRFNFDDSSLVFLNCHLTSGQSQVSERLEDLREIYRKAYDYQSKYQDYVIHDHDYKFIFGDLNFRISLPDETVRAEIKRCNYAALWQRDQLLQSRSSHAILSRFSEGQLNFDPTYKYDDHSDIYDSSQKKRIPAWCDRILYEKSDKCSGQIDLLHYGRKESLFSDHRPVFGVFDIKVCTVDPVKRGEIEKKLIDQLFGKGKTQQKQESNKISQQQQPDLNKQFNLMNVKIQEEYVENSISQSQDFVQTDNALEQLQGIESIDDLIGLSPQKEKQESESLINLHDNSNEPTVGLFDNLIDLDFGLKQQQQQQQQLQQQQRQQQLQQNHQIIPNQMYMQHQMMVPTNPQLIQGGINAIQQPRTYPQQQNQQMMMPNNPAQQMPVQAGNPFIQQQFPSQQQQINNQFMQFQQNPIYQQQQQQQQMNRQIYNSNPNLPQQQMQRSIPPQQQQQVNQAPVSKTNPFVPPDFDDLFGTGNNNSQKSEKSNGEEVLKDFFSHFQAPSNPQQNVPPQIQQQQPKQQLQQPIAQIQQKQPQTQHSGNMININNNYFNQVPKQNDNVNLQQQQNQKQRLHQQNSEKITDSCLNQVQNNGQDQDNEEVMNFFQF